MRKQTFQHAELRDENNEIFQKGAYGKNTDFTNQQNNGFIDYVMNNLEWLRSHLSDGGNSKNIADYTFKIGSVKSGELSNVTSRIEENVIYLDFVIPKGEKGERGVQGVQGEKGQQGEKGEQGKQGIPGKQGEKGKAGTIKIGKIFTVESNEKARVENVGTESEAVFNIYIPKGKQGEKGERGIPGTAAEKGEKGEQGEKGERGERGEKGERGERGERGEKGDKGEKGDTPIIDLSQYALKRDLKNIDLSEINKKMESKADKIQLLEKANKKDTYTRNEIYTKHETDGKIENKINKLSSDIESFIINKVNKNEVYTKEESDNKFQTKGNYVLKSDLKNIDLTEYLQRKDLRGLATIEYVDGRIKHVVAAAPEALDTLEEISKALNNDKDFASTITNELTKKSDKATVENALMGKADKYEVYTKEEIDYRFQENESYCGYDEMQKLVYIKDKEHGNKMFMFDCVPMGTEGVGGQEAGIFIRSEIGGAPYTFEHNVIFNNSVKFSDTVEFERGIENYYNSKDCDEKFQTKNEMEKYLTKEKIYQENMLKLPDGTLIGIEEDTNENTSGGANRKNRL